MNLFPAQPFDLDSIMKIERQAFIPPIQEKKRVFEKRLRIFPNGFVILSDASEKVVKENLGALTCGYICTEIWESFPDKNLDEKAFSRRFALGHNIKHTHFENGACLYVSSFALLQTYRGKGLGRAFFCAALGAILGAYPAIKSVALLASSEWKNALSIYESLHFEKVRTIPDFFSTLQKKIRADGIVFFSSARDFQKIEFPTDSKNEFSGIKINAGDFFL